MFKTNEEIIVIQAKATTPISTGVVFWSHDKGTAKMLLQLQKDYVNQTLAEGTIVPICLDFVGGRHIYHAVIEDAVNGIVSIVLEDNILGYVGRVTGSIYIELPDSRSLDTAGRFTFDIKRSPIDENVPELEDYYWQGFNEIMNQYHQTIAEIETESERLLNELQARILTLEEKLDDVEVRARFKTAWSWSADGTDRFTKVYPNENLVVTRNEYVGKMLEQTGKIVDNSTSNIMREKIQVSTGETLYFQKNSSETLDFWRGNWHKSDGTFLSRFANAINKFTMTVPAEAAFLWISYPNTGTNKIERSGYTSYTQSPIDDPINAYPTYKGISIVDSDDPVDYSWQAEDNTIAKKTDLTKDKVGLGNVDNYSTATQAEAEAGTATNKFMTPALVFKAIAKWVQGKFVSTTGNETVLGVKNFQDGLQVGGNPAGLVNDACWCEDFAVNNLAAGIVNPDIQRFSTSNAEAFSMIGKTITVKKAGVYLITLGVNYTGLSGWLTFGISRANGTSLVKRSLLESANSGSNSLTYVRSFEGNDQLTIEFNSGTAGTTMQKINLAIVKLA
ncbi:BppU family phage baseplate upper protein [Enterococcus dongliensis]|uniref:BppU family phage baseplate upper protein n=1 Tax=Enterococcus dongliensis TaxID=2559925 RepID=A0AAW8TMC4_9ENTE|nr:BppU family phage baseplate upper protein [Enterococcus dongliensis]MDT2637988.1 BppU family phage baseplate upper protein [Enterococcus dongliensis]